LLVELTQRRLTLMHVPHALGSLIGWLAIVSCAGQSGTEIKERAAACPDRNSTPIAADHMTDAGTVDELATSTALQQQGMLSWRVLTGDTFTTQQTRMTLQVVPDTTTARVIESDDQCPTTLAMDAVLELNTDDGSFNERFTGTLRAQNASLRFSGSLPLANLRGTYDAEPFARLYERPQFSLHAFLDSGSGSLSMDETAPQHDRDETRVSASIADWSPAARTAGQPRSEL
jgi:hypothetical protein